jgi:hypothetical protein
MQLVKNTAVDCSVWSQRYRNQTRLSTNFKKDVIMINSIWQGRPCKTVKAKILPGPNANGKRSSLVFVEGTVRYTKQKPGVKVNVWSLPIWLMMVKVSLDLIGICGMTQSAQRPIILNNQDTIIVSKQVHLQRDGFVKIWWLGSSVAPRFSFSLRFWSVMTQ